MVICIRTDLNMSQGKMAAQSAHASLKNVLSYIGKVGMDKVLLNLEFQEWTNTGHTKICLGIDSEDELMKIFNQAKNSGLLCELITDEGRTEFKNVSTKTCLAIGPNSSDKIDKITGYLKLI